MGETVTTVSVADALRAVVSGPSESWHDPALLRGRLADRQVPASEVNVLVNALQEGVPQRIRRERSDTPREVLLGILCRRLVERQGMTPDRAEWAARVWLDALAPRTPEVPDEFVWATPPDTETAAKVRDKQRTPPPPASRPWPLIAGVLAAIALIAILRWLADPGVPTAVADYTVIAVDVFTSDVGEVGLDEFLNFAATCHVGEPFPSERCRVTFPVATSMPFVGVDLLVDYAPPSGDDVRVPISCVFADPIGRMSKPVVSEGGFPQPGHDARSVTRWRTMFARPGSVWQPGLHHVTCTLPGQSVEAWFEVSMPGRARPSIYR